MDEYGVLMTVRPVTDEDVAFWEKRGERASITEMQGDHIGALNIQVLRCLRDDPAFPAVWRVPFVLPDGDGSTYWFSMFSHDFPPVAAVVQGEQRVTPEEATRNVCPADASLPDWEDEVRKDERRRMATLLEENTALFSTFAKDPEHLVMLICFMLRLGTEHDDIEFTANWVKNLEAERDCFKALWDGTRDTAERLRAALEEIAGCPGEGPFLRWLARRALDGGDDG